MALKNIIMFLYSTIGLEQKDLFKPSVHKVFGTHGNMVRTYTYILYCNFSTLQLFFIDLDNVFIVFLLLLLHKFNELHFTRQMSCHILIIFISLVLGLRGSPALGFQTHTHFLSTSEFEILKGFSKRGTFFARKFSSNQTSELLDLIDNYILLNKTTEAGLYWPGFYTVDTTTRGRAWIKLFRENMKMKNKKLFEEIKDETSVINVIKDNDNSNNKTITEGSITAWLGNGFTNNDKMIKRKKRSSKSANSWNLLMG